MVPSDENMKDMRRRLRKKLKEDLITVQGLSSRLEARARQILQSHPAPIRPSFSDAQFSGNGIFVRGSCGKEVTSQLNLKENGLLHHMAPLSQQQSLGADNGSLTGTVLIGSKRTPKASQVYKKSEFLIGKDKLPSPIKSVAKLRKGNGQATEMLSEKKSPRLSNDSKLLCINILKKLMGHEDGWIFNEPVDAIKLGLSDYHSVIKRPMDLGTIKGRLEKRQYASLSEFADDVKLTFNNAMSYNPPGNDVHQSAKVLLTMFQTDWNILKETSSKTIGPGDHDVRNGSVCQGPEGTRASSETNLLMANEVALQTRTSLQSQPGPASARRMPQGKSKGPMAKSKPSIQPAARKKTKDASVLKAPLKRGMASELPLAKAKSHSKPEVSTNIDAPAKAKTVARPIKTIEKARKMERPKTLTKTKTAVQKKAMSYEEKVRLQTLLGQLPQHKLQELIYLMRERNIIMSQEGDEIEVDLDLFDDDTLWELDRRANDCLRDIQKSQELRKRTREDNYAGNTGKRQKGLLAVHLERKATSGNKSSSQSDSSTDSDSGSSSTTDSDG